MYVCYLCMYARVSGVCELRPKWGSKGSRQQTLNITCNQQMTTQKMEGAEIEGLSQGRGKGGANMIIASIFAFFYFRLAPDARNHHQSIPDFPLFFRFSCTMWHGWFVCTSCSFFSCRLSRMPHIYIWGYIARNTACQMFVKQFLRF